MLQTFRDKRDSNECQNEWYAPMVQIYLVPENFRFRDHTWCDGNHSFAELCSCQLDDSRSCQSRAQSESLAWSGENKTKSTFCTTHWHMRPVHNGPPREGLV